MTRPDGPSISAALSARSPADPSTYVDRGTSGISTSGRGLGWITIAPVCRIAPDATERRVAVSPGEAAVVAVWGRWAAWPASSAGGRGGRRERQLRRGGQ